MDLLQVVLLLRCEIGPQAEIAEPDDGVHGCADLVAHIGEKSALRLVGRLRGLAGTLELLGCFSTLEYAPELTADSAHELQKTLVRRQALVHEEFEHRHHEAVYLHRQAERALDAQILHELVAGKVWIRFQVRNPGRLAGLRHPSRQALSHGKFRALGHLPELLELIGIPEVPD